MKRVVSVISSSRISRGRNSNGKTANSEPCDFYPNADEFEWCFSSINKISISKNLHRFLDFWPIAVTFAIKIIAENLDAADANAGTNGTRFLAISAATGAKADVKSWGP